MLSAQLVWLAGRVERVSQADQSADLGLVRDEAGDAATHRFTADDQPFGAERFDDLMPRLAECRFAIGRTTCSGRTTLHHVGELKSHHANSAPHQAGRNRPQKITAHANSSAVGQDKGSGRVAFAMHKDSPAVWERGGRHYLFLVDRLPLTMSLGGVWHSFQVPANRCEHVGLQVAVRRQIDRVAALLLPAGRAVPGDLETSFCDRCQIANRGSRPGRLV